jgi:hypothetical protein
MTKLKSNSFLNVTPGKTYAMAVGGAMPKRKKTARRKIQKTTSPAPIPPKSTEIKKLVVKRGPGSGKYKKGGIGCGCGGAKFQQGGALANTGTNLEPDTFNNKLFPNAIPAAAASAGFNNSSTINQPTIPSSSSENLDTATAQGNGGGYDVKGFLKKLAAKRQSMAFNTGAPTKPIMPEAINQFGSAKNSGSSMKMDSVGQKVFKEGGTIEDDGEYPSRN